MNTLTQPVIGLSARRFRGKDLGGTRQGLFTNVDPQRRSDFDRKQPPHAFETRASYDQGSFLMRLTVRQSPVEMVVFGLARSFEHNLGFSASFKSSTNADKLQPTKLKGYLKNGILVHHSGSRITSEDVAKALAEE